MLTDTAIRAAKPREKSYKMFDGLGLNEHGHHPDLIELQFTHAERNQVQAAYNKARRIPERRKMMQALADYLDGLRAGANVVPFKRMAG
jgi:hypothetical protein